MVTGRRYTALTARARTLEATAADCNVGAVPLGEEQGHHGGQRALGRFLHPFLLPRRKCFGSAAQVSAWIPQKALCERRSPPHGR